MRLTQIQTHMCQIKPSVEQCKEHATWYWHRVVLPAVGRRLHRRMRKTAKRAKPTPRRPVGPPPPPPLSRFWQAAGLVFAMCIAWYCRKWLRASFRSALSQAKQVVLDCGNELVPKVVAY
jgi:hypothetical protein